MNRPLGSDKTTHLMTAPFSQQLDLKLSLGAIWSSFEADQVQDTKHPREDPFQSPSNPQFISACI